MNVNFYLASTNIIAKREVLKNISTNSKSLILTADRNTLNLEKELLEVKGLEAIFDVNVTTIGRICKKYLTEKKLYKNVLTKHSSIALIKKILLENKDKLKIFKNNIEKDGFAEKIFETISLYRSCGITPDNFYIPTKEALLKYKLEDIKLIYASYEGCFGEEYTDSFNQLDIFEANLDKEYFKDTDIYLVDYEDITPTIIRVITKLAKCCNSLNICTAFAKKGTSNYSIYTNDIYYNLKNYFELNGVRSNNIFVEDSDKGRSNLTKLIFSGKQATDSTSKLALKLIKANNINDELTTVLTSIKKDVIDGKIKLSDIGLVVADLETYKKDLRVCLDKVELSYYIDESESLDKNILGKINLIIFECMCKGVNKYNLIKLIDTGIMQLTLQEINEYKTYIDRINAKGKYLYELPDKIESTDNLVAALNKVAKFVKLCDFDKGNINDYYDKLNDILSTIGYEEYYEMLYAKYVDNGDIINGRKLSQTYNKLSTIWNELTIVFKNDIIDKSCFYSIIKTFIQDIKLALAPIKVDSLIISDFNNSYIEEKDRLYIIGASDLNLPKYSIETALLSDKEINNIKDNNRLTPTINLINRRKKFKLFELLLKARQEIVFSFVSVDAKGEELYPTIGYSELEKYLTNKSEVNASNNLLIASGQENDIIMKNITPKLAVDTVVTAIKEWNLYNNIPAFRTNVASLYHSVINYNDIDYIANANYINKYSNIDNANKLFFRSKEVSPSEFESFANCPYAHFLNYGLRLKEKDKAKVGLNDIGNIIHEYMKNVIYDLANFKQDVEFVRGIKDFVKTNLDKVLSGKQFARFMASNINHSVLKSLYIEVERITIAILEQLANSDYEPKYLEFDFAKSKKGCIVLTLNSGKQIELIGKVDRIDINNQDQTFFIIDYKTGNSSFSNYTDFASGKKIQLFAYLVMFRKYSNLKPVGGFYLPINNKVETAKKYRYQGFFVNNHEIIGNIDNSLRDFPSSGITLRLTKTKEGNFASSVTAKNMAIESDMIDTASQYLIDNLKLSAEKIEKGCIDILPLNSGGKIACTHCKYKGICNFNIKYKNKYRKIDRIASLNDIVDIKEELSEEEVEDV